MTTAATNDECSLLKNQFEGQGFTTKIFPQEIRKIMLAHIDAHIREVSSSHLKPGMSTSDSLEKIAESIPDVVWSEKMTRAFRIFPKEIANKIHRWANDSLCKEFYRKRSAVNVVYPQEVETNSKLTTSDIAIYWRCVRPGKPDAGRPHRDASFWDLEFQEGYDPKIPFPFNYLKDCIKIWIPLKGCIPTTTLQVVPTSHNMEIPTVVEQTEYGRRPSISKEWLMENERNFISPTELSQGSCILFDMNLVHRGPAHTNTELRISAELNFIVQ
jgi:ectoine hydroxylase-related dioxygenase (phytanoyl-CoA dioxygenase family)